jgi:nucleoid DNA-binding protein
VTKNDMVIGIAKETGLRQVDIKRIVQLTLDGIIDVLATENRIELRNFGVFEVKERKARKARNPRTGAEVDVPAKFVATFKPGKMMEEKIVKIKHDQPAKAEPAKV